MKRAAPQPTVDQLPLADTTADSALHAGGSEGKSKRAQRLDAKCAKCERPMNGRSRTAVVNGAEVEVHISCARELELVVAKQGASE